MMVSEKELSAKSKEAVDFARKYTNAGCPIQVCHIVSNLVRRIYELEGVEYRNN